MSGGNDTSVASGTCYRYRELLSDNVGNQGTSGASSTAKVDTTAPPTPSLAFSGLSANAYWDGSGTLFIRPAASGTFTVTASSTDNQSGIASYAFGTLNSNGGSNFAGSQTGDHFDYTFDGTTTAPSTARIVSATNGAGTPSGNGTYSISADTTAPSVAAPNVTAGYYTSLSVPVTKSGGSDGGAGVDSSSSHLERDEATLSNGTAQRSPAAGRPSRSAAATTPRSPTATATATASSSPTASATRARPARATSRRSTLRARQQHHAQRRFPRRFGTQGR